MSSFSFRYIRDTPNIVDVSVVYKESCHVDSVSSANGNYFTPTQSPSNNNRYSFSAKLSQRAASFVFSPKISEQQLPSYHLPPSPALLSALAIMQQEERWLLLEDEGVFVVVTPTPPYLILWATKSWVKVCDYNK